MKPRVFSVQTETGWLWAYKAFGETITKRSLCEAVSASVKQAELEAKIDADVKHLREITGI